MTKPNLMGRLHLLVGEQGRRWKEIASVLEREGYGESGQPLPPNIIRKRYDRWLKAAGRGEPLIPEPKAIGEKQRPPSRKTVEKSDMMISAREVLELLKGSIERRDNMLASQITKEHDKGYGGLLEQRLETRLTEKINSEVNEAVQIAVEAALRKLQDEEAAFQQELYGTVEEIVSGKMTDHLASLLSGIEIKEKAAGPGRGHKGSSAAKFSATMPAEVYGERNRWGGSFQAISPPRASCICVPAKSILPEGNNRHALSQYLSARH